MINLFFGADRNYVGVQRMLAAYGPLLKPRAASPEATLLTTFMNWTWFLDERSGGGSSYGIGEEGVQWVASRACVCVCVCVCVETARACVWRQQDPMPPFARTLPDRSDLLLAAGAC